VKVSSIHCGSAGVERGVQKEIRCKKIVQHVEFIQKQIARDRGVRERWVPCGGRRTAEPIVTVVTGGKCENSCQGGKEQRGKDSQKGKKRGEHGPEAEQGREKSFHGVLPHHPNGELISRRKKKNKKNGGGGGKIGKGKTTRALETAPMYNKIGKKQHGMM